MAVVCMKHGSAAVTEAGDVFAWGTGDDSQLGLGSTAHQQQPARVGGLGQLGASRVLMLAVGFCHQAAVSEDGAICTWGYGGCGRLGHGDQGSRHTPTRLGKEWFGNSPVVMVSCGGNHTVALTAAGSVWTCGWNCHGVLGHGDTADRQSFTLVSPECFGKDMLVMTACGDFHNAVVTAGGRVWTWGHGSGGRLGHNDEQDRPTPALLAPERFDGSKIVMVAAGCSYTVAVAEDGAPWVWGWNWFGQLGLGDCKHRLAPTLLGTEAFGGSRVHMAACGSSHTLFVSEEGILWACGDGRKGQLGLNDRNERHVPMLVKKQNFGGARIITVDGGENHTAALTEEGTLFTWGQGGRTKAEYYQDTGDYDYYEDAGEFSEEHYSDDNDDDDGPGQIHEEYSDDEANATAPLVLDRPPVVPSGLGHADLLDRLVPTPVPPHLFDGARVGRCHSLPTEHALAFASGTHARLVGGSRAGDEEENSGCWFLMMPGELVKRIVEASGSWPDGEGGRLGEGVARLMGALPLARVQGDQVGQEESASFRRLALQLPRPPPAPRRSCSCSCSTQ